MDDDPVLQRRRRRRAATAAAPSTADVAPSGAEVGRASKAPASEPGGGPTAAEAVAGPVAPAMPRVTIYTDGACSGNPGPGGWGAILTTGAHEKELFGGERLTTNNRMELTAAIRSLEALKRRSRVDLYTDSQYVRQGITEWLVRWQRNGWLTADKKPVKNDDLWRRLAELTGQHEVRWNWVKGHAGHPENERADELARRGVVEARASAT